jgi:alkylhydroperoxidase family enzyme
MEPRFNLLDSPTAAKVAKRFCNAALPLEQSALPALRINLVAAWRETTVFTEAERAALALTEEGTRLADDHHGVSDETWDEVRKHYDDDQIGALVCLVAMINAANRMGVIVHQKGGSYEPGMFAGFERG